MGFLSIPFAFLGYLLVYAATANHGALATSPWAAMFADAYVTQQALSDASGGLVKPEDVFPGSPAIPELVTPGQVQIGQIANIPPARVVPGNPAIPGLSPVPPQ